jgi:hypothetical protein
MNVLHLGYHQATTNCNFYQFNTIRNYTRKQKVAEASVNFIMMGFPAVALIIDTHRIVGVACCYLTVVSSAIPGHRRFPADLSDTAEI